MASPHSVKDCVSAMQDATPIPISVKCRLGIDDMNTFEHLRSFIDTVSSVCSTFIIHARHAWLQGLSPKDNRNIPPLMYDWVYKIKQLYPHLTIIINGGITSLDECHSHLQYVDGVMLGRHIQQNPLFLTQVDETIFDLPSTFRSIEDILYSFFPYIETELNAGTPLQHLTRHLVTFYKGTPGAKKFRRYLSEHAHLKGAGIEVIEQGIQASRSI